ncbi:hypothetical protein MMC25_005087 [Agyrium rufum]|nr:hypothetical protein [Agyrium rufum]
MPHKLLRPRSKERHRNTPVSSKKTGSDWAIVSFEPGITLNNNQFVIPGSSALQNITGAWSMSVSGSTIIAAGFSPPKEATLSQSSTSLFFKGSFVQVKQMIVKNQLRPGDSGSWVIQENKVCGHIIAARQDFPVAYMIPMHHILEDIKRNRKATNVVVYQTPAQNTAEQIIPLQAKLELSAEKEPLK